MVVVCVGLWLITLRNEIKLRKERELMLSAIAKALATTPRSRVKDALKSLPLHYGVVHHILTSFMQTESVSSTEASVPASTPDTKLGSMRSMLTAGSHLGCSIWAAAAVFDGRGLERVVAVEPSLETLELIDLIRNNMPSEMVTRGLVLRRLLSYSGQVRITQLVTFSILVML